MSDLCPLQVVLESKLSQVLEFFKEGGTGNPCLTAEDHNALTRPFNLNRQRLSNLSCFRLIVCQVSQSFGSFRSIGAICKNDPLGIWILVDCLSDSPNKRW